MRRRRTSCGHHTRRTLIVPTHALTRELSDVHFGANARAGHGGARREDCTHYCVGPWLWSGLWRAVQIATRDRTAVAVQ